MEGSVVSGQASAPVEAGAQTVAQLPVLGPCSPIPTTPESGLQSRAERRECVRLRRMLNEDTGEITDYDPRKARVSRMRRGVHAWARTCAMLSGRYRCVMVTLTYAMADGWYPGAISEYIEALVDRLGADLVAIGWTAEIQVERLLSTGQSVMHYHVEMLVRPGTDVPKPDESGMWTHGWSNRKSWCGVYYLCKYASKGTSEGEVFPRGARMFGLSKRHWRVLALQSAEEFQCAQLLNKLAHLPAWVHSFCQSRESILEAHKVKGGWLVGNAVHRSPWRLIW